MPDLRQDFTDLFTEPFPQGTGRRLIRPVSPGREDTANPSLGYLGWASLDAYRPGDATPRKALGPLNRRLAYKSVAYERLGHIPV